MLKTTRLSELLAPRVFRVNDNEVVGNISGSGDRADEMDKSSAQFKCIKNYQRLKDFAKVRCLEQSIFLSPKASSVLFIKD